MSFQIDEFERKLIPVLNKKHLKDRKEMAAWASNIAKECRDPLNELVDFTDREKLFLDDFYDRGEVHMETLTDDQDLIQNFRKHPILKWRLNQLKSTGGPGY